MNSYEAFVMMPFGMNHEYEGGQEESEYVYTEIIEPGIIEAAKQINSPTPQESIARIKESSVRTKGSHTSEVRFNIIREVDRSQGGSITSAIVRSLVKADVVVADVTGRNPNVFLELGIRYAIRNKVTVLLAQDNTQIPFDIKGYRYIKYNKFKPAEARQRIANFVREGISGSISSDSVVFDVFPSMSVNIPGIVQSFGSDILSTRTTMSFDEYMRHIENTCFYLESALHDYRYIPTAVIGITNGGLIAADLIGKRVYAATEIPVLSLWAKRHEAKGQSAFWYFDNAYNDATMEVIKKVSSEKGKTDIIELLLIDDHMGTGSTAVQAVTYVKSRLGEPARLVFIPIISRRAENIGVVEPFLPYSRIDSEGKKIFSITKEQFLSQLTTESLQFPYLMKQINVSTSG